MPDLPDFRDLPDLRSLFPILAALLTGAKGPPVYRHLRSRLASRGGPAPRAPSRLEDEYRDDPDPDVRAAAAELRAAQLRDRQHSAGRRIGRLVNHLTGKATARLGLPEGKREATQAAMDDDFARSLAPDVDLPLPSTPPDAATEPPAVDGSSQDPAAPAETLRDRQPKPDPWSRLRRTGDKPPTSPS